MTDCRHRQNVIIDELKITNSPLNVHTSERRYSFRKYIKGVNKDFVSSCESKDFLCYLEA